MSRHPTHDTHHRLHRSGGLRAAVLGANDGIVSTASLIVGVASAGVSREDILLAGVAGLVAGALSMAAGEYVSVKSQEDVEKSDLNLEREALDSYWDLELKELAGIYKERGLDGPLARKVATQLMEHDALGAHARDEIGISPELSARPLQAALWSALAFAIGASAPLTAAFLAPTHNLLYSVPATTSIALVSLGAIASRAAGANPIRGGGRVLLWGLIAMSATAAVGKLFGVST